MVPVSNAVEGLRFWSKRERTDSLYMDHWRKEKWVCQQMSSMLTFCFDWRRHGCHVCVYTSGPACRFHLILRKTCKIPLSSCGQTLLWLFVSQQPGGSGKHKPYQIVKKKKHYRKQHYRKQYTNKRQYDHEPTLKHQHPLLKPELLHVKG